MRLQGICEASDDGVAWVPIRPGEGVDLILGQSHFIKSVEDLREPLVSSVPGIRFGLAFAEASERRSCAGVAPTTI